MPILYPATYAFAGTAKPILVAALVTGAGVTSFATPLTDTAANPRIGPPSGVRMQFIGVAAKSTVRQATRADNGPTEAPLLAVVDDTGLAAVPVAVPTVEAKSLPGVAPIDFVLESRVEPVAIAATGAKPAVGTLHQLQSQPQPGYMPAAELKAMMAGVVASRGDGDGLARSDVAIPIVPAPNAEQLAGEPATGKASYGIDFEAPALVNGAPAGRVPLRIADGENISVKLGDVLGTLQPLMDSATYEALASSQAAGEYVTFDTLRANGIAVRFDAQDRVVFGSS